MKCYACDVPLRRENVSPMTDDACRSCVPLAPVTDFEMAEAMVQLGGSFFAALGDAWFKADEVNRGRIVTMWAPEVYEFRELARLKRERAR